MAQINRRDFLRRSAILTSGIIAADQIELLERLTHQRRFFPSGQLDNWTETFIAVSEFRDGIWTELGRRPVRGQDQEVWDFRDRPDVKLKVHHRSHENVHLVWTSDIVSVNYGSLIVDLRNAR